MAETDRRIDESGRGKRKRTFEIVGCVFSLLIGAGYLVLFGLTLQTGYLTWFGVLLGILLAVPLVISPLLDLAGLKRLAAGLFFGGLGVLITVMLVMEISLWRAEAGSKGDWRPYRFDDVLGAMEARRAVPDAENAARRYEAAFASANMDDEPDFVFRGRSLRDEIGERPWKRDDHPQASEWLDSRSNLIDELLAIGRMEKCRWPVQADRYDECTVPRDGLRRSVLLLAAGGNRDLGEGRTDEALSKYLCILAIASHYRQQSSELDSVGAFGCERIAMRMLRLMLVQNDLSDQDVDRIAAHLPLAADLWPQEWVKLREVEKLQYMNFLGRLYEVNDEGKVRFARRLVFVFEGRREETDMSRVFRIDWLVSMPRDPRKVSDLVESCFARIDRDMDRGRPVRSPGPGEGGFLTLKDLAKAKCNVFRWGAEMAFFNASEYLRHCRRCAELTATRRGTWLVLGLRRYRNAHGVWPTVLDDVSPYVPAEAFFDPVAKGAFVYARGGEGFRLYGRGHNRIDDGGCTRYVKASGKDEDDMALWPPRVREPEPEPNSQEILRMYEQVYGKEAAKAMLGNEPNEKH